jgi:Pin2-interacting protein X1
MNEIAMLLSKKTVLKLGSQMNENAACKPSSFAMKQMEKMGWTEGKGLGKTESGISKHITIAKREEAAGLGTEKQKADVHDASETWWHDAFTVNLKHMKNKHEKKSKSGSKKRKAEEEVSDAPPSYDDLFKATGGARLGMRARADQKGKLKRTEGLDSEEKEPLGNIAAPVDVALGSRTKGEVSDSNESEDAVAKADKKKAKKEKKEKEGKEDVAEGKKSKEVEDLAVKEKAKKEKKKDKKDRK